MTITWKSPPPAAIGNRERKWAAVASELASNPGRWALVLTSNYNHVNRIKGRLKAGEFGQGFEAVVRQNGEQSDLYARFVGGNE